jgi:hypothetical protein
VGIEIWVEHRSWWSRYFGRSFRRELTLPGGEFENFLVPRLNPIYEKMGKKINIYGRESFAGEQLVEVGCILKKIYEEVDKGGNVVEIKESIAAPSGTSYHGELSKDFLLKELNQLLSVVGRAIDENKTLRFVGD